MQKEFRELVTGFSCFFIAACVVRKLLDEAEPDIQLVFIPIEELVFIPDEDEESGEDGESELLGLDAFKRKFKDDKSKMQIFDDWLSKFEGIKNGS